MSAAGTWRAAADMLGAELALSEHGDPTLRASFGGAAVDAWTTRGDASASTVVTARAPVAQLLLTVRAHAIATPQLEGTRAVRIGDAAFHRRYAVWSNDAGFARAWLGDNVRACIAATDASDAYDFTVFRSIVTARRLDIEPDAERLVRSARAVAALANQGRALFHQWRLLASALRGRVVGSTDTWKPDGVVAINALHDGSPVSIDSVFDRLPNRGAPPRLYTRVRCRRAGSTPRSYRYTGAQCRDLDILQRESDRAVPRVTERADIHAIVADKKTVGAYLLGLPTDAERLRAAMSVVEALAIGTASGPSGPYR